MNVWYFIPFDINYWLDAVVYDGIWISIQMMGERLVSRVMGRRVAVLRTCGGTRWGQGWDQPSVSEDTTTRQHDLKTSPTVGSHPSHTWSVSIIIKVLFRLYEVTIRLWTEFMETRTLLTTDSQTFSVSFHTWPSHKFHKFKVKYKFD